MVPTASSIMNRRSLLKVAAGTSVAGGPMLSGCLSGLNITGNGCKSKNKWCFGESVDLAGVADGMIFGRASNTEPRVNRPNEIVALDTETGERRWMYDSKIKGGEEYGGLTVEDGIYFNRCVAEDCIGVQALDVDGSERWLRETAVGHQDPVVVHNTVYITNEAGSVQALDATSGEKRWDYQIRPAHGTTIVNVTDAVYLTTDYSVHALAQDRGTEHWVYETGDQLIRDAEVSDGTAYVVMPDRVTAISNGAEQWQTEFPFETDTGGTTIVGQASNRLLVFVEREDESAFQLHAFDVATGDRIWTTDNIPRRGDWRPFVEMVEDVAYVGAERLRALDVKTGDEHWSETVDGGPIRSVTVVDEEIKADHNVFVHTGDTRFVRFAPDGERTWERAIDEPIEGYLVGENVFVTTAAATLAISS